MNLPVFILCGGQGTRLREETEFRPKPLVMIGGRPILWHIMKTYDHYGFKDFVLCLGYKAELIREYFLNYRTHSGSCRVDLRAGRFQVIGEDSAIEDWQVSLVDTGIESLTGTRIKRALKAVPADRFMVTYGDGVADIDLKALLDYHLLTGRLATISAVRPSSRFGELDLVGDTLRSFVEKPQTTEGWINGGFMVFEKEAVDIIPETANVQLEATVLPELARRGSLAVYRHPGFWQCMDTFREMQLLNEMWASNKPAWRVWE